VPPKRGYMDHVWKGEIAKVKEEAWSEGVEDLCEFATVTKKCYFCDQPRTILTNEHCIFCPNCMALYTFMLVRESNCEHIKNGVPTVRHSPYKYKTDKVHVYGDIEGTWMLNRC